MKMSGLTRPTVKSGFRFSFRHLTLRGRLAFFICGLFLVLCLAQTLYINLMSMIMRPFNLQTSSMVGFIVAGLVAGIGSYYLAGVALQPVREISRAARNIGANNLHTRLNWDGPGDELRELAEAFDQMLARLEDSFVQQGRFVADAAHELRTPLTTMRTNLELLRSNQGATLAEYEAVAGTLDRAVTRLERLVKDLLVLATQEYVCPGEEVALLPLLENIQDTLVEIAHKHRVALELERGGEVEEVYVRGDSVLLSQIFTNLIENAIRYNRPNGKVTLKIGQGNALVWIAVQDTGIGIAEEDQARIFDRFYRVDRSRSRHKGGAGLGLSIVQHLVRQHQGQIEVESALDVGTTFTILLPAVVNHRPVNEAACT